MNVLGIHTHRNNLFNIKNKIGYQVTPHFKIEYYTLGQELLSLIHRDKDSILNNLGVLLYVTSYEHYQEAVVKEILDLYPILDSESINDLSKIEYIREIMDKFYPDLVYKLASKRISKMYDTLTIIPNVYTDNDFNFVKSFKYGVMLSYGRKFINRWFDYESDELTLANTLHKFAKRLKTINHTFTR